MKYSFRLTVDIPAREGTLDREVLAHHFLDAITTWHGQLHPDNELWLLQKAYFEIEYSTKDGKCIISTTNAG